MFWISKSTIDLHELLGFIVNYEPGKQALDMHASYGVICSIRNCWTQTLHVSLSYPNIDLSS